MDAFGRAPHCPKCDSDRIEFTFTGSSPKATRAADRKAGTCGYYPDEHYKEHIHLKCSRCGFGGREDWSMQPAKTGRRVGFHFA